MARTKVTDERMAAYTISDIYPHYLARIERNGRTKAELDEVIGWLTGFDGKALAGQIENEATFKSFFEAATISPNAEQIKGVVCGVRVEEIENPLTQKIRYLDKVVDELARGRKIEKIMRA